MKDQEGQEIVRLKEEDFTPVCSIIVPVYNSETYLEECICSILTQTFTNYELILIDDGSTDKSRTICETFSEEDSRVRLIAYDENRGMSYARNKGMDAAKGKYILFIDSDDMIHPQLTAEMVREAENSGSDMVMTEFSKSKDRSELWWESYCQEQLVPDSVVLSGEELWKCWFKMDPKYGAGGKLFFLEKVLSLRFDEDMTFSEDAKFMYQFLVQEPRRISYMKSYGYYYRNHPGSASGSVSFDKLLLSVQMKREMIASELSEGRRENAAIIERGYIRHIQEWIDRAGRNEKQNMKKCRALIKEEKSSSLFRELPAHTKRRLFFSLYFPSLYRFLKSTKKRIQEFMVIITDKITGEGL